MFFFFDILGDTSVVSGYSIVAKWRAYLFLLPAAAVLGLKEEDIIETFGLTQEDERLRDSVLIGPFTDERRKVGEVVNGGIYPESGFFFG